MNCKYLISPIFQCSLPLVLSLSELGFNFNKPAEMTPSQKGKKRSGPHFKSHFCEGHESCQSANILLINIHLIITYLNLFFGEG